MSDYIDKQKIKFNCRNISTEDMLIELDSRLKNNIKIENLLVKNAALKANNKRLIDENKMLIKILNTCQLETQNESHLALILNQKVYWEGKK